MTRHELTLTEDGSPTLLTTYENGVTEKMHHFRGALTESLYIYEPAIRWSLDQTKSSHVMSLGLGLGYNELIAVAVALQSGRENRLRLTTYEIDAGLGRAFSAWLNGQESPWQSAYDQLQIALTQKFSLPEDGLRRALQQAQHAGDWQLRGRFPDELRPDDRFTAILYDAFSGKMDQDLWNEESLVLFLQNHADPVCALSTYASTGGLKRALRRSGFSMHPKPGFGGKKESTFATRP